MRLSKECIIEALDNETAIDTGEKKDWRHGYYARYIIPKDGKYYSVWLAYAGDEGFQWDDEYESEEVVLNTKTVSVWEKADA